MTPPPIQNVADRPAAPLRADAPAPKRRSPPPAVRRKPKLDFSITGLIYCTMMMFMGLAAINTQANLLFGVFGLMIGILLVSGVISRVVLRGVSVRRELPDHAIVGRPVVIGYQFFNRKKFWPSLSLTASELDGVDAFSRQPTAYMLHAAGTMTAVVPAEVIPRRRGLQTFDRFQLSTSFPFGFIKRAIDRRQPDTLMVLPAIGQMRRELFKLFKSAESSGVNVRPSRGGADDFYGLKEYRQGENPRFISWRHTARTGQILVREMTRVSPPKILVLIDTIDDATTATRGVSIERGLAMAATLIDAAMQAGMPIGLICWSERWIVISPNRGKRHRLDLLSELAKLGPNRTHGREELLAHARTAAKNDTTVVLISPDDVQVSLGHSARGGVVALSSNEQLFGRFFSFPVGIEFAVPPVAGALAGVSNREA